MKTSGSGLRRTWRYLLSMVILASGVAAIVGSGGGFPDFSLEMPGPIYIPPRVSVSPSRLTVEQGGTAAFTATAIGATPPVSFQWLRNGATIVGATSTTYTLVGANLGDDGAQFSVVINAANGQATSTAVLQVSRYPAVVFQDGEFLLPDWAVASITDPPQSGATFAVSRSATGGNPDAFRSITYQLPAGASRVMVFHAALAATYDPAALGAIYALDFGMDCLVTVRTDSVIARVMLEQNGRRFVAGDAFCGATSDSWKTYSEISFEAGSFVLTDGPACGTGETCPDFSANGAPIRFGFATQDRVSFSDAPPSTLTMGIDNWKATVWRK
jgi:hypothetical protein